MYHLFNTMQVFTYIFQTDCSTKLSCCWWTRWYPQFLLGSQADLCLPASWWCRWDPPSWCAAFGEARRTGKQYLCKWGQWKSLWRVRQLENIFIRLLKETPGTVNQGRDRSSSPDDTALYRYKLSGMFRMDTFTLPSPETKKADTDECFYSKIMHLDSAVSHRPSPAF